MIDWDKPLRTKSGLPARLVSKRTGDDKYIMGVIIEGKKRDRFEIYKSDGRYSDNDLSGLDLENVPEKIVRYVNYYPSGASYCYETRDSADSASMYNRVSCVRIEFEEGQFDE